MKMKQWMMLTALLSLTACDYVETDGVNQERSDRVYRAAMDDYRAGRVDAAIEGFQKVCVANPSNASARFQLACLLFDVKEDYAGAYCAYAEYLLQRPVSDKAALAKSQLVDCERKMASALATKYGLNSMKDGERRLSELQGQLEKSEKRSAKLMKDLEAAMQRAMALEQENERLKGFVRAETNHDETSDLTAEIASAKALQGSASQEGEAMSESDIASAKALLEESEEDAPLITQDPDAKTKRDAALAAEKAAKEAEKQRAAAVSANRPETYVIKDGDTLYKIALKFYGRSSAWRLIREANKTIISTDGRVRTGQKIVLPKE